MKKTEIKDHSKTHRKVFLRDSRTGKGPWPCYFCRKPCWAETIHHKDHDHDNDEYENLAPCHKGCHSTNHKIRRMRGENTSGHYGIHKRFDGKWIVRAWSEEDQKRVYVGQAVTLDDALELQRIFYEEE